jgi:5-methylcytosine-specific restriction endonuclease McrA
MKEERREKEKHLKKYYCKICGLETTGKNRVYCSDECRKKRESFRYYENHTKNIELARIRDSKKRKTPRVFKCKQCGVVYDVVFGDKQKAYCSKECARKARPSGNTRSRVRRFLVEYEYVNPNKVFERDGWICQLCGKKTPKERRGSFRSNAPELDHRIPISKGGPHLYSNLQCACRACNAKKSDRSIPCQLPLFEIKSINSMVCRV